MKQADDPATCCVELSKKPWVGLNPLGLPPKPRGSEFRWRLSCILLMMASTLSGEVFIAGWRSKVGKGMCFMVKLDCSA